MRRIPVDTSKTRFLAGGESRPQTDEAGSPRLDGDGRPLISFPIVALTEGVGAETLTVRVPGPVPAISPLAEVTVTDLVARPWSMNGRSGVSFSASSVTPIRKT